MSHYDEACEIFLNAYASDMAYRKQQKKAAYVEQVCQRIGQGYHGPKQVKEYLLNGAKQFANN